MLFSIDRGFLARKGHMRIRLRRREFIVGLGGAVAWPVAGRAQQGGRVRRIGWLMPLDENDPAAKTIVSAFTQALAGLGWADGRNLRMELRWAGDDINRMRTLAQELVGLQPDITLTSSSPTTVALQRETRTIPIVFSTLADPVVSRHSPAHQPAGRERHWLRPLRSLASRQDS